MKNLHRDKMRQKTLDSTDELTEQIQPPDEGIPDEMAERRDEAFLMKDLIERLPQREHDIITMYLLDELSYSEIEDATGLKQGNIRQIVMRTRQKLKEQFNKLAKTWMN
jgi:RNA polymerase sigma-70 factor (ECF subfamily)